MTSKIEKKKQNAARQKKYREKNRYRLNTVLTAEAIINLDALAKHYAVTKKDLVEMLVEKEVTELKKSFNDDTDFDKFYGVTA